MQLAMQLKGRYGLNVLPDVPNITVETSAASFFNQVLAATMAEEQTKDSVLGLVMSYVQKGEN